MKATKLPRGMFIEALVQNSVADIYEDAIKEWVFLFGFRKEQHCICGQPIIISNLIKNTKTNKMLVVGDDCLENYIGDIPDFSKSMIEEVYALGLISTWEHKFLTSILRFTTLSEKQRTILERISGVLTKHYMPEENTLHT